MLVFRVLGKDDAVVILTVAHYIILDTALEHSAVRNTIYVGERARVEAILDEADADREMLQDVLVLDVVDVDAEVPKEGVRLRLRPIAGPVHEAVADHRQHVRDAALREQGRLSKGKDAKNAERMGLVC